MSARYNNGQRVPASVALVDLRQRQDDQRHHQMLTLVERTVDLDCLLGGRYTSPCSTS